MCNLFLLAGSTDRAGGDKRPVPLTFLERVSPPPLNLYMEKEICPPPLIIKYAKNDKMYVH